MALPTSSAFSVNLRARRSTSREMSSIMRTTRSSSWALRSAIVERDPLTARCEVRGGRGRGGALGHAERAERPLDLLGFERRPHVFEEERVDVARVAACEGLGEGVEGFVFERAVGRVGLLE